MTPLLSSALRVAEAERAAVEEAVTRPCEHPRRSRRIPKITSGRT
jgi:hypothetical protein